MLAVSLLHVSATQFISKCSCKRRIKEEDCPNEVPKPFHIHVLSRVGSSVIRRSENRASAGVRVGSKREPGDNVSQCGH